MVNGSRKLSLSFVEENLICRPWAKVAKGALLSLGSDPLHQIVNCPIRFDLLQVRVQVKMSEVKSLLTLGNSIYLFNYDRNNWDALIRGGETPRSVK